MAYVVASCSCTVWGGGLHTYQHYYGNPLPELGSSLSHSVLCFAVAMLLDGGISKRAVVEYEMRARNTTSFELRPEEFTVVSNAQDANGMDEGTAVWMYVRTYAYATTTDVF